MALTVTPGGASDDSYITAADADAYFAGTLRSTAWTTVLAATRELALRQATQEIEALGGPTPYAGRPTRAYFSGHPYDEETPQALHFPRSQDTDLDGDLVIPTAIEEAVCEQAAWLLNVAGPGGISSGTGGLGTGPSGDDGIVNHGLIQSLGIQNWSMDGQSYTYRGDANDGRPAHIAPSAWERIRPYIIRKFRARIG
jgi:hypothetical protein